MSDDEFKALRRQYYGMIVCALVAQTEQGDKIAAREDWNKWAWKSADTMARRVRLTEEDEARKAREEAERLPLR